MTVQKKERKTVNDDMATKEVTVEMSGEREVWKKKILTFDELLKNTF